LVRQYNQVLFLKQFSMLAQRTRTELRILTTLTRAVLAIAELLVFIFSFYTSLENGCATVFFTWRCPSVADGRLATP